MSSHLPWPARRWTALLAGLLLCVAPSIGAAAEAELTDATREAVYAPVKKWIDKLKESKNAQGTENKRGTYSKLPKRIDDTSYEVSVHVDTAEDTRQVTQRYALTLKKDGAAWKVTDEKVLDEKVGLFRASGLSCYPFEKLSFDREGLKVSGGAGSVCETRVNGRPQSLAFQAAGMTYSYAPPAHAAKLPHTHDFYAVHKVLAKSVSKDIEFTPAALFMQCDPASCEEALATVVTGLARPAGEPVVLPYGDPAIPAWIRPITDRYVKERKDSAYAHFQVAPFEGNRYWGALVAREVSPTDWGFLDEAIPGSGVAINYNNWASWEVTYLILPRKLDFTAQAFGDQIFGEVYGYFTDETMQSSDPYEIEQREDPETRWYEVYSLTGDIGLGVRDAEFVDADLTFGITLKQDVQNLPFFIVALQDQNVLGRNKPAALFVNSIQLDGKELTWVKTGRSSGLVVLPEQMPAGSKVVFRMNFSTKAIRAYTPSFNAVSRFGWIPFVSFGDFVDEFDVNLRTPEKFKILGIGTKLSESVKDGVRISHWKAGNPVVFPSITFGTYREEKPNFPAKKIDGTEIPIAVHCDVNSAQEWDVTGDALKMIADQASNSINLYREVSGVDYPYGGLNLVNDPQGFLYGQAPSSLIYLGQGVFRGEGFLAPFFPDATGIAKFLKSVVAHEVGHEWWGSRVSNSNNRNYWFVESLAEYFSALYLEFVYSRKEYDDQVDEWRRNILRSNLAGSVQNASSLHSGGYQAAVYSKGPFAFHMLREMFREKGPGERTKDGVDKKFFEFLKSMTQELMEKREIVTLDIQEAAEKGLGGIGPDAQPYRVDLDWFFDQWLRGAGIPQYQFVYDARPTEDGSYIIEGTIKQRVVIGNSANPQPLPGTFYKGVIDISVKTRDKQDFQQRVVIQGEETPFRLKVPDKPVEVVLNRENGMLAHEVLVNKSW